MRPIALLGGYAADLTFGDPRRLHPVAGFGRAAIALEATAYAPSRLRGALFTGGLVAAAAALAHAATRASRSLTARALVSGAVTWASLGGRSLAAEANDIARHLERGDLAAARAALPALCGRDAAQLDATAVARATVESVAENTSDAVVGALVWGAVAGPAGVAAYRAANTLDAMIGNRSPRYARFGWAAARLDDVLGWPPARAGAGLTAACAPVAGGSAGAAWSALRTYGGAHPSPNAGRMEAAFAGALGVHLGGPLAYAGRPEDRPVLNPGGRAPGAADVRRAARLSLAVGGAAAALCAAAATLAGVRP